MACSSIQFNPFVGVVVGQAAVPGPANSLDCPDDPYEFGCGDDYITEENNCPWDDQLEDCAGVASSAISIFDALFPADMPTLFVPGEFKGAKSGMV